MDNIFGIIGILIFLVVIIAIIIGGCKVFTKAGEPGWASIVPIYNTIILLKIVDKPTWWIILLLIPPISFVFGIIVCIELAKKFGKGTGYGIGIAIFPYIFIPMLGFSDAKFQS